jgi:hypothetical protein
MIYLISSKHVPSEDSTGSPQDARAAVAQAVKTTSGQRPGVTLKKACGLPPNVAISARDKNGLK